MCKILFTYLIFLSGTWTSVTALTIDISSLSVHSYIQFQNHSQLTVIYYIPDLFRESLLRLRAMQYHIHGNGASVRELLTLTKVLRSVSIWLNVDPKDELTYTDPHVAGRWAGFSWLRITFSEVTVRVGRYCTFSREAADYSQAFKLFGVTFQIPWFYYDDETLLYVQFGKFIGQIINNYFLKKCLLCTYVIIVLR